MSVDFTLSAELRSDYGKGASRRLRRAERLPGIIYGAGANPTPISLRHNEVLNNLAHEAFFSHILTLNVAGNEEQAIIKDVQRHPFKQQILHMDFQRVLANEAITVQVPIHLTGEEECVGVKSDGGTINRIEVDMTISCLPRDLPEYVELDVSELNLGDSLHLSDIKLPEGVTSVDLSHGEDHDRAVVAVHATRAAKEEGEDGAAADDATDESGESKGSEDE